MPAFIYLIAAPLVQAEDVTETRSSDDPQALPQALIYQTKRAISAEGTLLSHSVIGSPFVRLSDGSERTIDLRTLTDADGWRYALTHEVRQDEPDAPVIVTAQLWRRPPPNSAALEFHGSELTVQSPRGTAPTIEPDLADWSAFAEAEATRVVMARLAHRPPLQLPSSARALAADDPVFYLEQERARVLAIEARKTEVRDAWEALVSAAPEGVHLARTHWLVPDAQLIVSPFGLDWLTHQSEVAEIAAPSPLDPDDNHGEEVRHATQVDQFLTAGLDGELQSGRNPLATGILLAVIDHSIDQNHPAWKDGASTSRVFDIWCGVTASGAVRPDADCQTTLPADPNEQVDNHGSNVAGLALADFMDGQVSGTTTNWREQRTGMSPESQLLFISGMDGEEGAFERAVEEGADVAVRSGTEKGPTLWCSLTHWQNDLVDAAMNAGVFWVNTPGNQGPATTQADIDSCLDASQNGAVPGQACTVFPPGTAAGAFTVGATRKSGNLLTNSQYQCTPHGPDTNGRRMIALVAPGGYEDDRIPRFDDDFGGGPFTATSYAAPIVAGAAANYKHHLISMFGASTANLPGILYGHMMLMADGSASNGAYLDATIDSTWGGGRLAMRMFNGAGMDSPAAMSSILVNIDQGETWESPLNDISGTNLPLSSDVDQFRSSAWWFEPNVDTGGALASISMRLCASSGTCYSANNGSPQQRRYRRTGIGGSTWTFRLVGSNVPPSTSTTYIPGATWRQVFAVRFHEDLDRDDADGPNADVR
jgi:hypothetical protein